MVGKHFLNKLTMNKKLNVLMTQESNRLVICLGTTAELKEWGSSVVDLYYLARGYL